MTKKQEILHELKHHFPFTFITGIIAGIIITFLFIAGVSFSSPKITSTFELFHIGHIFVSAIATSALYYKYKKSKTTAIILGFLVAIIVGSVSDVLFPFLIGKLFFLKISFHLPLIEEPIKIALIALAGTFIGIFSQKFHATFKLSHNLHVFLSVIASLFYVLAFTPTLTFASILLLIIIVFIVVYIPCSISDIIFPLLFLKKDSGCCVHSH